MSSALIPVNLYCVFTYLDLESMDTLTNLRTFLTVARSGSFSEAARQLHVVPSVVAKRIAQLEKTVQARLFERSTRTVALTDAGLRLMSRAGTAVAELDDVVAGIGRDNVELEGHIRLMAPATFAMFQLSPLLDAFLAEHPRITLEMTLADRSTNPLDEGVDMVISGRSPSYEGVIDVPLVPVRSRLCAASSYLDRRGIPAHPRDLVAHDCLLYRPHGANWVFQTPRGVSDVDVTGRLIAEDNYTLLQAALSGRGIAVLPNYLCESALASGRLLELLPGSRLEDSWFKAYVPRRRHGLARVRALLGWLVERLAAANPQSARPSSGPHRP